MEPIHKQLREFGRVRLNASLARYSSFKIGGPARYLIEVTDNEKLTKLLSFLSGRGIEYLILGSGANILFPDFGFRGAVIQVKSSKFKVESNVIEVEAGVSLKTLVNLSVEHSLTGLEWAAGIPGTVGGAIRGNAGARYAFAGGEIKDTIGSVAVWRDGEVFELSSADCAFGYRDSIFKHNSDVILSATFNLAPGKPAESLAIIQKILEERAGKQSAAPSAGSFFKNVPLAQWTKDLAMLPPRFLEYKKIAAGWLIEQAGLKGFRVGGAMISEEHGNFIINKGNATQADVLAVVEEVKGKVYTMFEVELEEEVMVVR